MNADRESLQNSLFYCVLFGIIASLFFDNEILNFIRLAVVTIYIGLKASGFYNWLFTTDETSLYWLAATMIFLPISGVLGLVFSFTMNQFATPISIAYFFFSLGYLAGATLELQDRNKNYPSEN